VTGLLTSLLVTVKAELSGNAVELSGSSWLRKSLVPSVEVSAESRPGGVPGTLELLVTVVAIRDAASLPASS